MDAKKPLVINLAAGPGAGKSTTAAMLFGKLKLLNKKVELVTEFAKDLTYEGAKTKLETQVYVLGNQYYRLVRLADQVDYIVTDSPLFLSRFYGKRQETLWLLSKELFDEFNNAIYFIERLKPYQQYGRSQTEDEARDLDCNIRAFIAYHYGDYVSVFGDEYAAASIISDLKKKELI